ncbi:hypothetical protein NW759_010179 [Fusarium solani]|jgi:hypothetical protein|nr:hypothetical protein NW759_010179 [Fusarium solani]
MAELVPAGVLGTITYHIITLAIETGQANDEVRRSLELVRTCDRDLQHLISLRDEHLDILERKPIELERINLIIEDAHKGLLEVGRIVEKCRPEANRGKLPFARRGRWVLFDSKQFNSQVPVINGHHQAVLTEITFLRQIALHIPTPVQNQVIDTDTKSTQKKRVGIDNINLLGSLMGRKPGISPSIIDDYVTGLICVMSISGETFDATTAGLSSQLYYRSSQFTINSAFSTTQAPFLPRPQFHCNLCRKTYQPRRHPGQQREREYDLRCFHTGSLYTTTKFQCSAAPVCAGTAFYRDDTGAVQVALAVLIF